MIAASEDDGKNVIAAIIRDSAFVVPHGNTKIEVEDRVFFIGPAASIRRACDMFAEVE